MDKVPAYIGLEMINPLNGYRSVLVHKAEGVWVFAKSPYYNGVLAAAFGGTLPDPNVRYKHLRAFKTEKPIQF